MADIQVCSLVHIRSLPDRSGLSGRGVRVQSVKGGAEYAIYLEEIIEGRIEQPDGIVIRFFELYEEARGGTPNIVTQEGSAYEGEVCRANVVCRTNGRSLSPISARREGRQTTYRFSEPDELIVIQATRNQRAVVTVKIIRFGLIFGEERAVLTECPIWEGRPGELSPECQPYRTAVRAAVARCHCRRCHEPHYVACGKPRRSSRRR